MLILGNRALVELIQSDDMTTSKLLWIPNEAKDPSYTGIVQALGPDQHDVRVGDRIVFSRYAGVPVDYTIAGRAKQVVVDANEILAVFDDNWLPVQRKVTAFFDLTVLEKLDLPGQKLVGIRFDAKDQTVYIITEENKDETSINCTNNFTREDALSNGR